jgi:hypothetical protein
MCLCSLANKEILRRARYYSLVHTATGRPRDNNKNNGLLAFFLKIIYSLASKPFWLR